MTQRIVTLCCGEGMDEPTLWQNVASYPDILPDHFCSAAAVVAYTCNPSTSPELVTACIYVAAKVEEINVSANQLINSARLLCHPSQQQLLHLLAPYASQAHSATQQQQQQLAPQLQPPANATTLAHTPQQHASHPGPAGQVSLRQPQQQHVMLPEDAAFIPVQQPDQQQQEQESIVVAGDAYYAAKDRLFTAEQVLLRLMSFQLRVQQPHKQLLNYCKLLHAPQALAAAAVCLLNDAVAYTGLCISHAAAVVAAAALQLAARAMLQSQGVGSNSNRNTPAGTDLSMQPDEPHTRVVHVHQRHRLSAEQYLLEHGQHGSRRGSAHKADVRRPASSSAASADDDVAAVAEGSWIMLIGLQQGDVDEVIQVLSQLLLLQQQQQQESLGSQAT